MAKTFLVARKTHFVPGEVPCCCPEAKMSIDILDVPRNSIRYQILHFCLAKRENITIVLCRTTVGVQKQPHY